MAKYCNEGCEALCDFCIHFKEDNYEELKDSYADGICEITGGEVSYSDFCLDKFECFRCYKED